MFPGTNRWVLAGLAALVVANVILLTLLLRPVDPPVSAGALPSFSPVAITPGVLAGATEGQDAADEEATVEAEVAMGAPAQRLLAAADDLNAWRAIVGRCDEPAALERTQDGGLTWRRVEARVAPAVRMKATATTTLFVIGGSPDADCAPTFAFSRTSGTSWVTADEELPGSWYLAPNDRATVHGPTAEVPLPCEAAVDLAGLDADRAALLCVDGGVWLTDDGGSSWGQEGSVLDAVAIAPGEDGYVLGILRPETCEGVAVFSVGADGTGLTEAAAIDTLPPGCAVLDGAAPGEVALAVAGENVWLWAGDVVAISVDSGLTWATS